MDVYGYDPLLPESVIEHFGAKSLPKLDKKMDAVIIAVAHSVFKKMQVYEIRSLMNDHPVLIDVRGIVDRDTAEKTGIFYRKL